MGYVCQERFVNVASCDRNVRFGPGYSHVWATQGTLDYPGGQSKHLRNGGAGYGDRFCIRTSSFCHASGMSIIIASGSERPQRMSSSSTASKAPESELVSSTMGRKRLSVAGSV